MRTSHQTAKTSRILLYFLLLVQVGVTGMALRSLGEAERIHAAVSASASSRPTVERTVTLGSTRLAIPTYELFKTGNVWAIISRDRPLQGEASHTLVDIPVAHGDEKAPMKIAVEISAELERLINAAEADGEPLMVSSAYRSLEEQAEIYDDFVNENGQAMADQYVLPVGASEHHTGLSVDFSSVSDLCAEDSDSCSLSQSGAAWLAANAARFGFIQRYPEGKRAITGVGYEPWHYRFVGVPLARAVDKSGLTLEEAYEQIAPGYARATVR